MLNQGEKVKTKISLIDKQRAFTLLELLIVLAIMALGSAIIIPSITNTDSKIFHAQIKELAAILKYNRRNAVISGQIQLSQLFPYENDKHKAIIYTHKKKGSWYSRGATFSWLEQSRNLPNSMINIQFFPQGGATGGILILQQGSLKSQLVIDSFTGKLSIEEVL